MSDGPETVTLSLDAPPVAAVQVGTPAPGFTGAPGNLMADLAAIAAEQAPAQVQTQAPAQPEITEPAPAPVTVPEKFKGPDGELDVAKVEKSTIHAEEALRKFQDIERQLRQQQNNVAALKQGAPIPVPPQAVPTNVQLSPFVVQVAQDMINKAAARGYQMPEAQAVAQAEVLVQMYEAKHSADVSLTESLRQRIEDQDRRRELEAIAKDDPTVFSPQGIDELTKIRQENPWVNQSPNPWQAANDLRTAAKIRNQRLSGQVQPTPTGPAAKAPPTPVGPAPRVTVQSQAPTLETQAEINDHLKTLSPAQEAAFWRSRGLRF